MNDTIPPHPAGLCLDRMLHDASDYVHRDPVRAVAIAFGAGVALNLVPPRVVGGTLAAVAGRLARPALVTMGLLKLFELCYPNHEEAAPAPIKPSPSPMIVVPH